MTERFELACLDMAGTTVADDELVALSVEAALRSAGVDDADPRRPAMLEHVRRTMGTSKIEVFTSILDDDDAARRANDAFEDRLAELLAAGRARPIPGAEAAMATLRAAGLKVALTTGFAPTTRDHLLEVLGWVDRVDLVVSPADAGRGRPFPDMILYAMAALGVGDARHVAVAGDTRSDMEAGSRAGATVVAGVLTGTHDRQALVDGGATHVLHSVAALPALLGCR